jgi:lysophospholipase L1-like esterase
VFALLSLAAATAAADPFSLKDGDRVVWIGSTVTEREQRYGYWETALHAAFPKADFTVRNLGWSGDTVFGDARAGFDTPKEGFKRLVGLTLELKPTVIFVSYGTNESFEGVAGLPKFEAGLEKLLDALAPAKARVMLFTPVPFDVYQRTDEALSRNKTLDQYSRAIAAVAGRRGVGVADLNDVVTQTRFDKMPLTENGMHYTAAGYRHTARAFLLALGVTDPAIDAARLDPLRRAVVAKNELFFHRWRPQNETYLFGFRKHEQGKNAKEVAQFDPLVARAEKNVARIKMDLLK